MVHFVGAGSGAIDLITVRGKKLIEEADVIIYAGSLINPELLSFADEKCELYDSAYMTLEEVIKVMEKAEQESKKIIRLHTGDPSIYGAIREQMDSLERLHIGYDICPGVSSFCGAAAELKAEYTLPNVSQSVIITRISGRTKVKEAESIRSFAAHQATMVIFLSTGHLKEVTQELIAGGYDAETPAAIVYKATWKEQKIIKCTVAELDQKAAENQITKTALITVGNFLGNQYDLSKLYDAGFSTEFREAIK